MDFPAGSHGILMVTASWIIFRDAGHEEPGRRDRLAPAEKAIALQRGAPDGWSGADTEDRWADPIASHADTFDLLLQYVRNYLRQGASCRI
ncbi:hypothetical protein ACFVU0_15075 [Streptomyces sp. NPDC058122]|uniref:hypothetical protein n=1 Tax=Streptomyces sp. NPDC058122 TaxID=3346349 RepID=UPI0036EA90FD